LRRPPIPTLVPYTTLFRSTVAPAPAVNIDPGVTDWFIVRSDTIRSPQAYNSVMAVWQPPLGIMNYDGYLGAGQYSFVLSPNANRSEEHTSELQSRENLVCR